MFLSEPLASLRTFFHDEFNKILSRQLTPDRSYISRNPRQNIRLVNFKTLFGQQIDKAQRVQNC